MPSSSLNTTTDLQQAADRLSLAASRPEDFFQASDSIAQVSLQQQQQQQQCNAVLCVYVHRKCKCYSVQQGEGFGFWFVLVHRSTCCTAKGSAAVTATVAVDSFT